MGITPANKLNSFLGVLFVICFAFTVVFYCQLPALSHHYVIKGDCAQYIFPFYRIKEASLFQQDLLTQYSLSRLNSRGAILLYSFFSFFLEPLVLTKILPFILVIISVFYLYKISELIIKDYWVRFIPSCLFGLYVWTCSIFAGGCARSFAYPLFIMFLYFLTINNLLALGIILVLQCLFYPQIALISILTYTLSIVGIGRNILSVVENKRRFKAYMLSIFICFCVLAILYLKQDKSLGGMVSYKEMKLMQEYYLYGRTPVFFANIFDFLSSHRAGINLSWPLTYLFGFSGILLIVLKKKAFKIPLEIYYFLISSVIMFCLAYIFLLKFHYPGRYLFYTLPLFLIFFIGISMDKIMGERKIKSAIVVILLISGSVFLYKPYLKNDLTDFSHYSELYNYLSTLPENALLAGHPKLVDAVPIFSKRKVLVTFELSQPWYKDYYRKIKERTVDFFRMYYSGSFEEVQEICGKYGIEYLIVNKEHFSPEYLKKGEFYLEPFNAYVKTITKKNSFVLMELSKNKILFEKDNIFVVKVNLNDNFN